MAEYNGWKSYETWLVNLWLGEDFRIYAEEQPDSVSCNQYKLADALKDYTEEHLQLEIGGIENGLVVDLINGALSDVNWDDIASHYVREEEDA